MEPRISISQFDKSYTAQLIELASSYYTEGHHALSNKYIEWQYSENPFGPAVIAFAEEGSKLIGVIAFIPIEIIVNGEIRKAYYAINVLTHPKYRSKHIFSRLISSAKIYFSKSEALMIGHPNTKAIAGWRRQEMNFRAPLKLFISKFSYRSLDRITSETQINLMPDTFWDTINKRESAHIRYTREFIIWRFLRAPFRNYKLFFVKNNGDFIGIRVSRSFKYGIDLMIDAICDEVYLGDIVKSFRRPTLVISSKEGSASEIIVRNSIPLPLKREVPFFVTDLYREDDNTDISGISLAASDF